MSSWDSRRVEPDHLVPPACCLPVTDLLLVSLVALEAFSDSMIGLLKLLPQRTPSVSPQALVHL